MIPAPRFGGLLLLGWVRVRLMCADARAMTRAPLKLAVIVGAWGILLLGLYGLFYRGLAFLHHESGVGPFLLDRLWYLFLFIVVILLAVSQLAGAYSTMMRAPEMRWWMSLPLSVRTLCRAKWIESSTYSSWAVVLLTVPLLIAYLMILERPLWLVGWMGLLIIPLTIITTALATVMLLIWLRWFGRFAVRREVVAIGCAAVCGLMFWMLGERHEATQQDVWHLAMEQLFPMMRVSMTPWLPSSWVAKALSAGLNGRWFEGFVYAAWLWATAAVAWRLLDHVGAWLLMPVLQRTGHPVEHRPQETAAVPSLPWRWWMRHPFRASLMKDILLVIRDPMQWTQAVVFFGLLGAYFANIHRLTHISVDPTWRIGVASLNLACTLLVFGSLCVRFVYPQISLEGRSLWLLRLAPQGTRLLIQAKLCLYGTLAVVLVEGLLWLSATRLDVPGPIQWWLAGVGLIASVTLVALTVGLGAWWADPSAQDAARIVSSSTGALVLVLMLGYVACVVASLVVAWGSWSAGHTWGLLASGMVLILISAFAGWVPIRRGLRRLEHLEEDI